MQTEQHTSWADVDLADLFAAFRKAKADCFFERSVYCAELFSSYEQSIFENLGNLLDDLHDGRVADVFARSSGKPRIFAKGLDAEPRANSGSQCFFSDADRAFERLLVSHKLIPEFRLVGSFEVEMHVLSGLWINLIGHKYDQCLRGHAFGSRVRRFGHTELRSRPSGDYQYEAVGSFEPYFQPYREWRDRGIDSRVRAPRKESFARDLCRIRGGKNDHLVVVEIDPASLRAQQSRVHRWPTSDDRYKPAPEGYKISPRRKTTPS